VIDEATAPLEETRRPRRWAWALMALLAVGAGAAALWARYRGLL